MDNLGSVNPGNQRPNDPIPFDSVAEPKGVSHAPLNLGGPGAAPAQQGIAPKPGASGAPAPQTAAPKPGASGAPAPQSAAPRPVAKPAAGPTAVAAKPVPVRLVSPAAPAVPASRITGVRTFFTKLHPGAISFLDEQISRWLTENPNIVVKQINVAVGEVEAKKTEPNIIITVWF